MKRRRRISVFVTERAERSGKRFYVLRYSCKGKRHQRATGLEATKKNRRSADRLCSELELKLNDSGSVDGCSWLDFQKRYIAEQLEWQSQNYRYVWLAACKLVDELIPVLFLDEIDSDYLSRLAAKMRARTEPKPLAESTIRSYLRHLCTSLRWAEEKGLLSRAPTYRVGRKQRQVAEVKHMRSRAITKEELERYIAAADAERPNDSLRWKRLIEGLWLTGLRINEALRLSWDEDSDFRLVVDECEFPHYRILKQKSGKAEICAIPHDAAAFLRGLPGRRGPVFGLRLQIGYVKQVLREIGQKSRVVVDAKTRKTVTAHDLRRSFGTRWSTKVSAAVLQRMMRHACYSTTEKFYISDTADEIGKLLKGVSELGDAKGDASPAGESVDLSDEALKLLADKLLEQIAARGLEPPLPEGT